MAEGLRLREVQDLVLRVVEHAERTIRTASAMKARALAHLGVLADQEAAHTERVKDVTLASSRAVEAAHRSGIAEVATAIRVPEGTVRRAWEDARTTAEDHPLLWKALLDGQVTERHVTVALEELTTLPRAARGSLEAEILEKAPTVTAASLQSFARRRRELLHPESVGVRHRRARAGRHVILAPPRDGMSTLTAHLPAVAAHAIYNRCTDAAMAVQAPDDPRTLTQLRADAFMAYALADGALLVPRAAPPDTHSVDTRTAGGGTAGASTAGSGTAGSHTAGSSGAGSSAAGSGTAGSGTASNSSAGSTAPGSSTPSNGAPVENTPGNGIVADSASGDSTGEDGAPSDCSAGSGLSGRDARMLEAAYVESLGDDDAHAASAACDVDVFGIVPTVAVLVPVDWLVDDAAQPHDLRDDAASHHAPTGGASQHRSQRDEHPPRHDKLRLGHDELPLPAVGEIVGAGPIDRETARALVAQSPSLRRILTDPHTGVPLDMSRSTYRIPAHLRVFTQLRDATCRFPSCRRRAEACDLDHVDAWEEGGTTSASNLAHLCRMHHRLKHAGAWAVQVVDDAQAATLRDALNDDVHGAGSAGCTCRTSDGGCDGCDGQHRRAGGRLTPSTLRWTSPTGRTSTTRASLDPTSGDGSETRAR